MPATVLVVAGSAPAYGVGPMLARVVLVLMWVGTVLVIGSQAYEVATGGAPRWAGALLFTVAFTLQWAFERRKPEPDLDGLYVLGMCVALASLYG